VDALVFTLLSGNWNTKQGTWTMTPQSLLYAFFSILCIAGTIAGSVYDNIVLEILCSIGFFCFTWKSVTLALGKENHECDS
jgi:hypothetical protein